MRGEQGSCHNKTCYFQASETHADSFLSLLHRPLAAEHMASTILPVCVQNLAGR